MADQEELLLKLTRYADGQMSESEAAAFEAEVALNPAAQKLLARWQEVTDSVRRAVYDSPGKSRFSPGGRSCPGTAVLSRLFDGLLSPMEKRELQKHLLECDRCLAEVIERMCNGQMMASGHWPDIPPDKAKKATVRGLVHYKLAEPSPDQVEKATIIVPLEKRQLKVFTSGQLTLTLVFTSIEKTDSASLELEVDDTLTGRYGREISLSSRQGRKHFSGETDRGGRLTVPRLQPGIYILHILGSPLKVEINLTAG